jgi:hypothetical protein
MKLYYSDVLSPHKACAVARYLKSPVEFVYLDLVKGEQQAPAKHAEPIFQRRYDKSGELRNRAAPRMGR